MVCDHLIARTIGLHFLSTFHPQEVLSFSIHPFFFSLLSSTQFLSDFPIVSTLFHLINSFIWENYKGPQNGWRKFTQLTFMKWEDDDGSPKRIFPPYLPCFQSTYSCGFMEGNEGDHYFRTAILAFQNKDTKKSPIETTCDVGCTTICSTHIKLSMDNMLRKICYSLGNRAGFFLFC